MADHLHVEIDGDPRRPVLLLLHGFMSSALQWSLDCERLARRFRIEFAVSHS